MALPRLASGIALALLILSVSVAAAATRTPSGKVRAKAVLADYVPGEVIVRFKPGVDRAGRAAVLRNAGAERKRWLRLPRAELLSVRAGRSVEAAINELEAQPDVLYAEPNYIYRASATYPNDPRFGDLWGLHQAADHDIDAPDAWDLTTGSSAVKVAVVDTGVAYDHPDLASNVLPGYDFISLDSDPRDEDGHGTHVAGTIGAVGNNGIGVSGVNWDVSLIPVRVLGPDGGTNETVTNGFAYAAQQGAKVVNASLGGGGYSQAMKNAIDAAAATTLFVVAAGNDGQDNDSVPSYPCNYASINLVCVAATNETDGLADFSNYGATSVDLAAPGTGILSTWPAYTDLLTETFESDLAGRWVAGGSPNTWARTTSKAAGGTFSVTDSPAGSYPNHADNWLRTTNPVDMSGQSGCQVAYAMSLASEPDFDYLHVEASADGTNWTPLDSWAGFTSGGAFYVFETALSGFSGQPAVYVGFRLESDEAVNYDGAYIDDVKVRCLSTAYSLDDYNSIEGTSMATPHAAGVAALVWALNPAAGVTQVRGALLSTVDAIPGLAGAVVTGGRLNAERAVQAAYSPPPPPPTPPPPPPVEPPPPTPPCPPVGVQFGAVYRGTHAGGGGVCLTVTPGWTGVLNFVITDVDGTDVYGEPCAFAWAQFPDPLPIANRSFQQPGVLIGSFPADRSAQGVVVVSDSTPPPCTTGPVSWTATTDATPPWVVPPAPQPPAAPRPAARCVVPSVKGKTLGRARALLASRRCRLGRVSRAYSRRVKAGRIIRQSKRVGARLPRGTRVHVLVSRGRRR